MTKTQTERCVITLKGPVDGFWALFMNAEGNRRLSGQRVCATSDYQLIFFLLWNQISAAPLLGETIFQLWDGGVIREVKGEGKLLNLGAPLRESWSECFAFCLEKWTYKALNVKSQRLRPRGWCTPTISHQDQIKGCVHPSIEDK